MDGTGGSAGKPGSAGRWRIAAISAAAIAFLVLVALAVWAVTGQGSKRAREVAEKPDIEHALPTAPDSDSDETSESAGASPTTGPGSGGTNGASGGGSGSGSGSSATTVHRNPLVAYRLGGALYVAAENGSGAVRVAPSVSGVFSLSPDGRSLAYVDMGARELVIADVAGGASVNAGAAEQVAPVWSPDSSWVLFARPATGEAATSSVYRTDILRANRKGGLPDVIAGGVVAAAGPDSRTIVVADIDEARTTGYSLKVIKAGSSPRTLSSEGPVTGLATDGTRAFVAVSHGGGTSQQGLDGIWVVPLDGTTPTRLVAAAPTARPVETRSLLLSPDGSRLMYAVAGDDGYSRAAVVSTSGGTPSELARRRDAYPLGWSADGSSVYFIEGNAWQGESTALVRTQPDGSGRIVVVQGAGL